MIEVIYDQYITTYLFLIYQAGTPEQDKMFEQLLSKCSAKEEASSDDVARLINRDLPTTPAGNCLQACIMENVGLVCF